MKEAAAANIATVRAFNRSFTQRIGALDDGFMQTGRPLAEARVLFEVGHGGSSVLDLRQRLGLDSGYLSRLLRELERDRLVRVVPDPTDGRRRRVELTRAGRSAWTDLDQRSTDLVHELLAPLSDPQRTQLADALHTADRLIRAATIEFDVVDPSSADAVGAMTAYFRELAIRFVDGFEPGDTLIADAPTMRAPAGAFVVARSDDAAVACGGVLRHNDETGEIKRMWIDPAWRGVGLGRRMLARLEQETASLGYRRVVLDTNDTLTEAISMYERAGYRAVERYNDNPYAHHWFAKSFTGRV